MNVQHQTIDCKDLKTHKYIVYIYIYNMITIDVKYIHTSYIHTLGDIDLMETQGGVLNS